MIQIKYAEIYKEGNKIGIIAQDSSGKVRIKAKNEDNKDLLSDLIIPYLLEGAIVDEDISVSSFQMMLPTDPNWIDFLEYNIPYNLHIYEIKELPDESFKGLKIY